MAKPIPIKSNNPINILISFEIDFMFIKNKIEAIKIIVPDIAEIIKLGLIYYNKFYLNIFIL